MERLGITVEEGRWISTEEVLVFEMVVIGTSCMSRMIPGETTDEILIWNNHRCGRDAVLGRDAIIEKGLEAPDRTFTKAFGARCKLS